MIGVNLINTHANAHIHSVTHRGGERQTDRQTDSFWPAISVQQAEL